MFFSENLTYPGFVEYTLRALLLIKEGFGMKKIFHRTEKAFTVACHAENTKQTIKNILHPLNFSAFQDDFNEKCKDAFTLAETLTTLLVIGIVASLTIPSLMANYKERQFASAKKKAMSTLLNGYKKMISEEATTFQDMPIFKCNGDFNCLSEIHKKIFSVVSDKGRTNTDLPGSYQKLSTNDEAAFNWANVPYIFTTSDGTVNGFVLDDENTSFSVVVDLNGKNSPNKVAKDLVKFRITNKAEIQEVTSELDDMAYTSGYISGYGNGTSGYDSGMSGYDTGSSGYDSGTSGYDSGMSGYDTGSSGYSSGTSGYGDSSGFSNKFSDNGSGCNASNLGGCKSNSDIGNLYQSASSDNAFYGSYGSERMKMIKMNNGDCLYIGYQDGSCYSHGADCTDVGPLGNGYCYQIHPKNSQYCR